MDGVSQEQLWRQLVEILHHATFTQEQEWATLDLTMPQLKVLMALHAKAPRTVTEIAKVLGLSVPAATHLVRRLSQRGLVSRTVDPEDRRAGQLRLSPQGDAIVRSVQAASADRFAEAIARLSPAEQQLVALALDVLAKAYRDPAR